MDYLVRSPDALPQPPMCPAPANSRQEENNLKRWF